MLSNFQAGDRAALFTVLVGQPGFRGLLQTPLLQPLRQRVIAACHLEPLDAADSRGYVEHRLERAGAGDAPVLAAQALDAIFAASGGVPRCINLLCDRVLLSGFLADCRPIGADVVNAAAEEMAADTLKPNPMMRRLSDRAERK
jgi:type II secretory pathway predicted ATPase ExeA